MKLTSTHRIGLAIVWLLLLGVLGMWISSRIQVSGDLRKFMPAAQTPAQKLLIDEMGEGPGSRLLLMSIEGSDAETLADQSRTLHAALAARPEFSLVANGGDASLESIPAHLRPYR